MLVVAVTAFVKLLWPPPDLSEWREVQELYLWQAAHEWPSEENMGGTRSVTCRLDGVLNKRTRGESISSWLHEMIG
jgi:hypothetical protein